MPAAIIDAVRKQVQRRAKRAWQGRFTGLFVIRFKLLLR